MAFPWKGVEGGPACVLQVGAPLLAAPANMTKRTAYQTSFTRWRAAESGFSAWQRVSLALQPDGTLRLDPATAVVESDPYAPGGYNGHNFYNGGSFVVGMATSA